jgi:hypothetical protein
MLYTWVKTSHTGDNNCVTCCGLLFSKAYSKLLNTELRCGEIKTMHKTAHSMEQVQEKKDHLRILRNASSKYWTWCLSSWDSGHFPPIPPLSVSQWFIPISPTKFYHFTYSPFRLPHFTYYPFRLLTISPIHHFVDSPFRLLTVSSLILCLHFTFLGNCQLFQDFQSAFKGIVQIAKCREEFHKTFQKWSAPSSSHPFCNVAIIMLKIDINPA